MSVAPGSRLDRAFGDLLGPAALPVLGGLLCQMGLGFGYVFAPLAGEIIAEFGWTRTEYASARAPQLFVLALFSPVVGALTVRYGPRRVLLTAVPFLSVILLATSRLESLWQLTLVFGLLGLALSGVGDVVVSQLVTDWVDRGRGLALGIVMTGSNLAGFILVPIAVWIAEEHSWREAIAAMGAGGLFVMLPLAWWLARERYPDRTAASDAAPATERSADDAIAVHGPPELDLRGAMRTRSFWLLAFGLFTFFFYFLGMLEHFVLFLTDEGMPRSEAAGHYKNAIGVGVIAKITLGLVADQIPRRAALLIDYGMVALSSVLLLWLPDPHFVVAFVLIYGFSNAARDVVYPLIIGDCFGVRHMAAIYGGLLFALLPGGVLGPIFAANLYDRTGSYDTAFATFAALNTLAVVGVALVRDERPRRSPA